MYCPLRSTDLPLLKLKYAYLFITMIPYIFTLKCLPVASMKGLIKHYMLKCTNRIKSSIHPTLYVFQPMVRIYDIPDNTFETDEEEESSEEDDGSDDTDSGE